MTSLPPRPHLVLDGSTTREVGEARGTALRRTLGAALTGYQALFRALGISEKQEREGAEATLETLFAWRPSMVAELEGIAAGSGLPLIQIAALNARTEILALSDRPPHECSTATSVIEGNRYGVQTWDWHIEFEQLWHTHEVGGPGYRFAGLSEQGIVSKIGINEAGLGLHLNILGHALDRPEGVPVHVLSRVVLTECGSVAEALRLIHETPITSSSAFTLIDPSRAVSVELSPVGIFEIPEIAKSVQRTNHFQHVRPLAGQKSELHEPESSARLALLRRRIAAAPPISTAELVKLFETGAGDPPLTCTPDLTREFGERWATLATVVTEPHSRTVRIFDGMPPAAAAGQWLSLTVS